MASSRQTQPEEDLFAIGVSVRASNEDEALRLVRAGLRASERVDPLRVPKIAAGAVLTNGPVQILNYEHGEGRAVLIYTSEEKARKALATIARQFWVEARDHDEELPERPPEDDATAIRLYFDARGEVESYSITETVLDIRLSVDESEISAEITGLLW